MDGTEATHTFFRVSHNSANPKDGAYRVLQILAVTSQSFIHII